MTPFKRQEYMDRRGIRVIRPVNRESLDTNGVNGAIYKDDGTTLSWMEAWFLVPQESLCLLKPAKLFFLILSLSDCLHLCVRWQTYVWRMFVLVTGLFSSAVP